MLDAQVLLDPFEEQFDLPPAGVKLGDGERRQGEVVGQKDQRLVGLGVLETDATQPLGVTLSRVRQVQFDVLIADQSGAAVDHILSLVHAAKAGGGFAAIFRLFEATTWAIDDVMAKNPGQLAEYRSGKDKLFGFFVGQVMKATGGKANPAQVNDLLRQKLA